MTKKELLNRLKSEGFRPDAYILDGGEPAYDALVLTEIHGHWFIEYVERGIRKVLGEFDSENLACNRFYELMCKDATAKL